MTGPEHDRDEARLKELFDATAEAPDRVQLTKLSARACDVPTRGRRPGRWQLWAPFAALAAGALAILALRGFHAPTADVARAPSAVVTPNPARLAPSALALAPEPSATASAPGDLDGPENDNGEAVAGLAGADDEGDWLAPLSEPAEDDVDVWLSATDAFLEDG